MNQTFGCVECDFSFLVEGLEELDSHSHLRAQAFATVQSAFETVVNQLKR